MGRIPVVPDPTSEGALSAQSTHSRLEPCTRSAPEGSLKGQRSGLIGDAAVGIVGALVGDWLLYRFGLHFGAGIIVLVINATIGAIVLLLALRLLGAGGWGGHDR